MPDTDKLDALERRIQALEMVVRHLVDDLSSRGDSPALRWAERIAEAHGRGGREEQEIKRHLDALLVHLDPNA